MKTLLLSLFTPLLLVSTLHAALDTAKIESLTGLKGTANEAEGTFKVTAPRTDVKIAVDGWTMPQAICRRSPSAARFAPAPSAK